MTELARPRTAQLGPVELLRIRQFVVLYVIAAVVLLGVFGQTIARSWLAFELTGSNTALGGVWLTFGVTMLISTPFAGVAADRLPKRLVIRVALSMLVITGTGVGLAVALGVVQYWMLLVASVIQAVGLGLFNPARMAFLAELVPSGSVGGAVSLLLINAEANRVVGPALAGLVIGVVSFGTSGVFLGSATLSLVGIALSTALPYGSRSAVASTLSPWAELKDGIAYVGRHPDLRALLWCGVVVGMVGMPYQGFLPTVAHDLFGAGSVGYGVLAASAAAGAVVTGLLLGARRGRPASPRLLAGAGIVFGLGLVGAASAPLFGVEVAILVVVGGGLLAFQTANQSMLLSRSDPAYHGRIQGLVLLNYGAFGIASLPLGALADHVGLRWTIGGMGVVVVVLIAGFVLSTRSVWSARRDSEEHGRRSP